MQEGPAYNQCVAYYLSQGGYVFIGVCLFVCLLAGLHKHSRSIFIKFRGNVPYGPRKNPLDFGGKPDHVTLGLEVTVMG